ncbi:replication endonuclease [Paraglaciecola hydrolytica]|uniref:replication endonuclease n=1 Tax=Paraglaciecola hydrolytica TaxID=1799789 RepID=UPI000A568442|nr:replication endonuclease [Paraglaciecola hydrolytica]
MNKFIDNTLERELISRDSEFTDFFESLHFEDRRFVRECISHYPRKIQRIIIGLYRKESTPFLANTALRQLIEKLNAITPPILLSNFDAGENELRELADEMANRCRAFQVRATRLYAVTRVNDVNASKRVNTHQSEKNTCLKSVNGLKRNDSLEDVYLWCRNFVNEKGLIAPEINTKQTIEGCVKRMQDRGWWLRKLRRLIVKSREKVMLELNQVNRLKGIYCSDLTAVNRKRQKEQQLQMLDSLTMTNELGEQFSLRDLHDVNVSNPTIRRNELMTRMSGFEEISKESGHIGIFVTLTCPSKYHRAYSKSGQRNPKWQGLTPYDGQQYLCSTWAKMRAELGRQDIRMYGLRVAEPQHDGTPHWHMMLFIEKAQAESFKAIIERYSFEEDGNEQGARENRVKFVDIDPSKGSATGYVAKYVCKNIDGADLEKGVYGEDPIMAAQRVEAWASCWGIRQFQQIGGVSVTVWRELRRFRGSVYGAKSEDDARSPVYEKPNSESLRSPVNEDSTFTELRSAADSGNWASYTKLMGGVFCIRKSQAMRPYYELVVNKVSGLIKTSWFDGLITTKLKGIKYKGSQIITRIHTWQVSVVKNGKAGTDFLPSLGVL